MGALKRNGHYTNGRQRWLCISCRRSFSWRNAAAKHRREQEWFRRWLVEGYSVRQLASQSGYSPGKLHRMISYHLEKTPPQPALDSGPDKHLILDGTFLRRPRSLIALMDAETHRLVAGRYGVSESSEPQLTAFLQALNRSGLLPRSFTVDGNPTVIKVLDKLWPDVTVQRCLVHIQRQGLSWCRSHPKTTYARKLRKVFLKITNIHTPRDRDDFLRLFNEWENRYGTQLGHRPESGPVFSDIKRARSMLLRALPNMFHYLDNPLIPISTNGLESYFSRLKAHYRQHRGLRRENCYNYFNWYFHLVPK